MPLKTLVGYLSPVRNQVEHGQGFLAQEDVDPEPDLEVALGPDSVNLLAVKPSAKA